MRFERFDLNLLVSLDALLTEQSVTRAAEKVFISQSAMSYTLARLREVFGDPLLTSIGRSMVLTPFARSLVAPVRDALGQMRELLALRPAMPLDRVQRELHVVASDHITLTLLTEVFRVAATQAPGLRLRLQSVADFTPDMLDGGAVDLLIGAASVLSDRHPDEPLVTDRFVALVWTGNDTVGDTISRADYQRVGHVATRWRDGRVATLDQMALRERRIQRCDDIVVPDFNLVAGFVVGTHRVATLPRRLAQLLARQWPVRLAEIDVALPEIAIRMQWPRLHDSDPVIGWLRRMLRETSAALDVS